MSKVRTKNAQIADIMLTQVSTLAIQKIIQYDITHIEILQKCNNY